MRGPVTDLTATLLSAWALAGEGDAHAAVDAMDKLSGPDWYGIFKDLHAGLILDLDKDSKAAGKRYASAYKADPTALRTVEAYGRWLSRNASKDDALKVYADFAKELPNHPVIVEEIKADFRRREAAAAGRYAPSRRRRGALRARRLDRPPRRRGSRADLSAARTLSRADHAMALLSLGDLYEDLKKPDLAIKAYERVPASSPLSRNAQIQMAVDLDTLDRTDEVQEAAR